LICTQSRRPSNRCANCSLRLASVHCCVYPTHWLHFAYRTKRTNKPNNTRVFSTRTLSSIIKFAKRLMKSGPSAVNTSRQWRSAHRKMYRQNVSPPYPTPEHVLRQNKGTHP